MECSSALSQTHLTVKPTASSKVTIPRFYKKMQTEECVTSLFHFLLGQEGSMLASTCQFLRYWASEKSKIWETYLAREFSDRSFLQTEGMVSRGPVLQSLYQILKEKYWKFSLTPLTLKGELISLSSTSFALRSSNIQIWRQTAPAKWDNVTTSIPRLKRGILYSITDLTSVLNTSDINSSEILIASVDGDTASLWKENFDDSDRVVTKLAGHKTSIMSIAISRCGKRVITGSWDKTAKIWTEQTDGNWESVATLPHTDAVYSVAFNSYGILAVTGSRDNTAKIWAEQTDGNWKSVATLTHPGCVCSVAVSSCGRFVVTGSFGKFLRVWTQQKTKWATTALLGNFDWTNEKEIVERIVISPDSSFIAAKFSGNSGNTVRLWSYNEEALLERVHTRVAFRKAKIRTSIRHLSKETHLSILRYLSENDLLACTLVSRLFLG